MDGRFSSAPHVRLSPALPLPMLLVLFVSGCGQSYVPTEPLGRGRITYSPSEISVGGAAIQHEPNYLLVGVNVDGALTHVDPIYWTDRIDGVTTPRELFEEFELVYRTLLSHRGAEESNAALASFRTWTRRQPWPADESGAGSSENFPSTDASRRSSVPPEDLGMAGTLEPWFLHYWSLGS